MPEPMTIEPARLMEVPTEFIGSDRRPQRAYTDRKNGWVVQVWDNATDGCNGTPWKGTLRVAVKHSGAKTMEEYEGRSATLPITWDDLQAIKDHLWPKRIAVEVYPPKDKIVNVADMRWLWVLPEGASLPFNLTGELVLKSLPPCPAYGR